MTVFTTGGGPGAVTDPNGTGQVDRAIPLRHFVGAALAACLPTSGVVSAELERIVMRALAAGVTPSAWAAQLIGRGPNGADEDRPLQRLARAIGLTPVEQLTLALLTCIQRDGDLARAVETLQAPLEGMWPMVGLAACAFAPLGGSADEALHTLMCGAAARSGALQILDSDSPAVDRRISMRTPLFFALLGRDSDWQGASFGMGDFGDVPLSPTARREAARQARGLAAGSAEGSAGLVIRSGSPAEARALACAVVDELDRRPVFLDGDDVDGLAPWLLLGNLVPIFTMELGPGERRMLPPLPYYRGPVLATAGVEGLVDRSGGRLVEWRAQVPAREEREQLWGAILGQGDLAHTLAREHRHGLGRIAALGAAVRRQMALDDVARPSLRQVEAAIWESEAGEMSLLAEPLTDPIPPGAFIANPMLEEEMSILLRRCRSRDRLAEGLGSAVACRYRPGVRALFIGPSGTGKTLAAGWLATQLGTPLYRVDLAAVTSKYIGETEKNLAQLLARAEQADVMLLFDEADSMFGRRTDVASSNDRFANAQTNYLLQRIERFDGVVILTSNTRSRIDSAFIRRLDAIIEFPRPGPEERRSLWLAHLGDAHNVTSSDINRLAATVDLAGGHVRNVVIHAAVQAEAEQRPIEYSDIIAGLKAEVRKLGAPLPAGLT